MCSAREELESEYNAREDYIAELKAEHFDPCWNVEPTLPPFPRDWEQYDAYAHLRPAPDQDIPF